MLKDIYDFMTLQQSIVFVEMKKDADSVAGMMRSAGFEVSVLHGSLEGGERDRVMDDFRAGRTKVRGTIFLFYFTWYSFFCIISTLMTFHWMVNSIPKEVSFGL